MRYKGESLSKSLKTDIADIDVIDFNRAVSEFDHPRGTVSTSK